MVQIAVLLHATNVWQLDEQGQRELGGVLTWRTGAGSVRDEIVESVCAAFEKELRLNEDVWNESTQPIVIGVDETREIPEAAPPVNTGLVFYVQTDE